MRVLLYTRSVVAVAVARAEEEQSKEVVCRRDSANWEQVPGSWNKLLVSAKITSSGGNKRLRKSDSCSRCNHTLSLGQTDQRHSTTFNNYRWPRPLPQAIRLGHFFSRAKLQSQKWLACGAARDAKATEEMPLGIQSLIPGNFVERQCVLPWDQAWFQKQPKARWP